MNGKKRSRLYSYSFQINARIGEYEYLMLKELVDYWKTTISEAIRRTIVYTYSKFITKRESLSEEELKRALQLALSKHLEHR